MLNEEAANRPAVIRGTQLALIHHLCWCWRNLHIQINKLLKQELLDKLLALPVRPIPVDCELLQLPRTSCLSRGQCLWDVEQTGWIWWRWVKQMQDRDPFLARAELFPLRLKTESPFVSVHLNWVSPYPRPSQEWNSCKQGRFYTQCVSLPPMGGWPSFSWPGAAVPGLLSP